MVNKQVKESLNKFKLRLSLILNIFIYFKKIVSKVKVFIMTFHSNFLNSVLFSNQSKILEVKE